MMSNNQNPFVRRRAAARDGWRNLLLITSIAALSGCSSLPSWLGGTPAEKPKLAGERIAVLPVDTSLKPDAELEKVTANLPAVNKNNDWPTHSGAFNSDTSNLAGGNFEHSTSATAGDGESFESTLVVSPVVGMVGGEAVVFAMDATGHVSAHHAEDISRMRWHDKGVALDDGIPIQGGGLAYDNGKLYVASGRGIVAAMDATTGRELWRKTLHIPFRSAPKAASDKLFVTTIDNQLYALNAANGEVLWNQRGISESTGLLNTVSPAVAGDVVVAPYSSGEIYVLSAADGKEAWSDTLSGGSRSQASALFAGIGGDPVIDGNVVIAASSGGMLTIRALANGQPAWALPVGSNNTPWVTGEYLFLLTSDNTLLCLHKYDGHIRWSTKLQSFADEKKKKNLITWKGPVMVDGKLALAGSNGQLLLVSATDGKIASSIRIPEGIYTAPVVAGGRMYLESQDATLYELH